MCIVSTRPVRQQAVRTTAELLEVTPASMTRDEYRRAVAGASHIMRTAAKRRAPDLDADDVAQELCLYLLKSSQAAAAPVPFSCVVHMRIRTVIYHMRVQAKRTGRPMANYRNRDGRCVIAEVADHRRISETPSAAEFDAGLDTTVRTALNSLPTAEQSYIRKFVQGECGHDPAYHTKAVRSLRASVGQRVPMGRPISPLKGTWVETRNKGGRQYYVVGMCFRGRSLQLGRVGRPDLESRYHRVVEALRTGAPRPRFGADPGHVSQRSCYLRNNSCARMKVAGRWYQLGRYGSPESVRLYYEILRRHGRQPAPLPADVASHTDAGDPGQTVGP